MFGESTHKTYNYNLLFKKHPSWTNPTAGEIGRSTYKMKIAPHPESRYHTRTIPYPTNEWILHLMMSSHHIRLSQSAWPSSFIICLRDIVLSCFVWMHFQNLFGHVFLHLVLCPSVGSFFCQMLRNWTKGCANIKLILETVLRILGALCEASCQWMVSVSHSPSGQSMR